MLSEVDFIRNGLESRGRHADAAERFGIRETTRSNHIISKAPNSQTSEALAPSSLSCLDLNPKPS